MPELINISLRQEEDDQVWFKVLLTVEGQESSFEVLSSNQYKDSTLEAILRIIPYILKFEQSYLLATTSPGNSKDWINEFLKEMSQFANRFKFRNVECNDCFALKTLKEKEDKDNTDS